MAQYVPDSKSKRWVVIAPERTHRPDESEKNQKPDKDTCVFCEGNEHMTPPELFRIGSGENDKPGWKVRVVPNKYPITDIHEVIIHTPDGHADIEHLPVEQVARIITAYRFRYQFHIKNGHVLIFCNHGIGSGASRVHPHSQLVVIPSQIILDTLEREPIENVVEETDHFITYCPDFSQWPYEAWICPKKNDTTFGNITDEEIAALSWQLKRLIKSIESVSLTHPLPQLHWGDKFAYNFYIYPRENWYLRVIPRNISRAGFELGTGIQVNLVRPSSAAQVLQMEINEEKSKVADLK